MLKFNLINGMNSETADKKTYMVVSRNVGQEIFIGNDIRVKLCEMDGNKARIGVSAPKDVPILRDNVKTRVKKKK